MKDYSNYKKYNNVDMIKFSGEFHFNQQLKQEGTYILVNGKESILIDKEENKYIGIIRNSGSQNDDEDEFRIILFDKKLNIQRGDYINYLGDDYLIVSDIDKDNHFYNSGKLTKCNQLLKWKDDNGIHEYPCVMNNDSYGSKISSNNDYISELDTKAKILVQNNEDTKNLDANIRFIFSNSKTDIYNCIKVDKAIYKNVIKLTLNNSTYLPNDDDLENNLAYNKSEDLDNKPSEPPTPTEYEIIGEKSFKQNTESIFTLSPSNSNCVWYIDDFDSENIATIVSQDSTSCTVKALSSYDDEFFTLYAKDGDTILVQKEITTTRK